MTVNKFESNFTDSGFTEFLPHPEGNFEIWLFPYKKGLSFGRIKATKPNIQPKEKPYA